MNASKHGLLMLGALAACGDNGESGDPDAAAVSRCLDAATLGSLSAHVEALRGSADLLGGHPGRREAVGFFHFPGLAVERAAVNASLFMECSAPTLFDPFCEKDGLCSRIECTGAGAGWVMHFYLEAPVDGAVDYQSATIDVGWLDGATGITFAIQSATSGAPTWSVSGTGAMDVMRLSVEETYAALHPAGAVALTASVDPAGAHAGQITVAGEVVALADATTGAFEPAQGCP